MKLESTLKGTIICLKAYLPEDVTQEYVDWLNDSKVNQYLEARYRKYTLEDEQEYVRNILKSDTEMLMAMVANDSGKVIGNVHLTLNPTHKRCFIAYMIGDTSYWGRGIATECVKLATKWCFENLDIYRMDGGLYSVNIGSAKAIMRAGYKEEGVRPGYCLLDDGTRTDEILYGLIRDDYNMLDYSK